jgi:ferritin-like metal-binding protein YciE
MANMKLTDERLRDDVILGAAAETEHHEIAVYEELMTYADTMGRPEINGLLRQNLEQEQHTLDEVRRSAARIARETLQPA